MNIGCFWCCTHTALRTMPYQAYRRTLSGETLCARGGGQKVLGRRGVAFVSPGRAAIRITIKIKTKIGVGVAPRGFEP